MTEDTQAAEPDIKIIVEAVDAPTLGEATISRLIVQGNSETVNILASVVLELLGGDVRRTVVVDPDGTQTVVASAVGVQTVDILDVIGDSLDQEGPSV